MAPTRLYPIATAVWAILGVVGASAGPPEVGFQLVGQWGGDCGGVALRDGLAYTALTSRIVVLDVSGAGDPALVSKGTVLPWVDTIVLYGDYAYGSGNWDYGLQIFDVSNPAGPTLASTVQFEWPYFWPLTVRDHYLYGQGASYGLNDAWLVIMDVSDPLAPTPIYQWPMSNACMDIIVTDEYIYAADAFALDVLDNSEPSQPVPIVRYTGCAPWSMYLVDDILYMGDPYDGVQIVDVCDVLHPVMLGTWPADLVSDVEVAYGYAYVLTQFDGLQIVDVSNPAAPVLVGACIPPDFAFSFKVLDGRAYVCAQSAGLLIYDVSDPSFPQLRGAYSEAGGPGGMVLRDGWLMGGFVPVGMRVMDISDPAEPTEIASYQPFEPGTRYGFFAHGPGDLVFAYGWPGALIMDVSEPDSPSLLYTLPKYAYRTKFDFRDALAYFASSVSGLDVYNIADPSAPTLVGSCLDSACAVRLQGDYAYVAAWYDGLHVIDISQPAVPTVVGTYQPTGLEPAVADVAVDGSYAYLAMRDNGLDIVDVSNPAAPRPVSRFDSHGVTDLVALSGDYAFIEGRHGLLAVDVSDPSNPIEAASYSVRRPFLDIASDGSYVYLSSYHAGLFILRFFIPGDVNCDGRVNVFDIDPFVQVLVSASEHPPFGSYLAAFPKCDAQRADCNGDGAVNTFDIDAFVQILTGPLQ
jgi:hypothetical protein